MKHWKLTAAIATVVMALCIWAHATTFAANLLPASTGYDLGSLAQRWDGYIRNLFVTTVTMDNCGAGTYVKADGTGCGNPMGDVNLPAQPVDVGVTYNSTPTASLVIVRHPFPFAVTIPINCTNSYLIAETAATASTTFSLQKCTAVGSCSQFGTAVFSASGTSAAFTCATATSFTAGQYIKVIAPASPDSTLAAIGGGIYGTRAAQ